jgi:hypothetical protein
MQFNIEDLQKLPLNERLELIEKIISTPPPPSIQLDNAAAEHKINTP